MKHTAVFVVAGLLVFLGVQNAWAATYRKWQPIELSFTSQKTYQNPLDFHENELTATFTAPSGATYAMLGFFNGDTISGYEWEILFTPTESGVWHYKTHNTDTSDAGLDNQSGQFTVSNPATNVRPVFQHGGFIKPSSNGHYLTYTDNTPFFSLGDTWFASPDQMVSNDLLQQFLDKRVSQGYSVISMHGCDPLKPNGSSALQAIAASDSALNYWKALDVYMKTVSQSGMVAMVGIGTGAMLASYSEDDLEIYFHNHLARYGAYPIGYFITQEYNLPLGNAAATAANENKIFQLGQFLNKHDAYHRALTVHPWVVNKEDKKAWSQPWYTMIWLQEGHLVTPTYYAVTNAYFSTPARPVIQAEENFEGFKSGKMTVDAEMIRWTAYTNYQAGAAGYNYGAQGLYGMIMDVKHPKTTGNWGPVLTAQQGIGLPGGEQMKYLVQFYNKFQWWNLVPWPKAIADHGDFLVKASNSEMAVYFPPKDTISTAQLVITMANGKKAKNVQGEWFDPRTGNTEPAKITILNGGKSLQLPSRIYNNNGHAYDGLIRITYTSY